MGVRSAIAGRVIRAAKAFSGAQAEPPGMAQAARDVSQMTMDHPFAPGEPIGPYDGYDRTPRVLDYRTGYNIATRPRIHERVSFDTLTRLIDSYDVASICIWHKIDTLRGLRWKLLAADGYNGDVTGAIGLGMQVMRRPDGIHSFRTWFAKWFYDVLAYDAAPLFRLRNRGGQVIGLMPFSGPTLAPLMDYWGNPPMNPGAPPDEQPEAYVQYVNGVPWNWLTRADVIYEPFRAVNSSLYGKAPIESIILNANTDLRFQLYFLQKFTEGNIPAAFASAPETWSPDQIEQFQAYWDSYMYADQARKSQVQWIPGGSAFAWSNEKDFTDQFSLFMMRKTCACFTQVPTDLGFTETSNYSSGESQADVQHKAGELPPMEYAEEIISRFLYDDLGLPVKFEFDRGEDQADRLVQAQADQLYIDRAVISASEVRELRYGLPEPQGQIIPRVFFTTRAGPIPLNALLGVAGKIDPATGAPDPGTPLPHEAFTTVPGVEPNPPLDETPLAVREYGPKALPPAPVKQPEGEPEATDPARQVAKEDAGEGITSETGIYGDPLIREDEDDPAAVAKEMAAFRRFERARFRDGRWRDFRFAAVGAVTAHNLNDAGRAAVRKQAGETACAGLAVLAADTGRVLMIQRALIPGDPAGGTWEFPGGHLGDGETPLAGAWREWAEETGCVPPPGAITGQWASPGGVYQGIVWTVESEGMVPVRTGTTVTNPDDPDGDAVEAVAWWDPAQLPGNPAIRPELAADLELVLAAFGWADDAGPLPGEGSTVAKAAGPPKAGDWPGWKLAGAAAAYWAPQLTSAVTAALPAAVLQRIAAGYLAAHPAQQGGAPDKRDRNAAAAAWLTAWLAAAGITVPPGTVAAGIVTDGYLIGAASAASMATGAPAATGDWKPGDSKAAGRRIAELGAAAGLAVLASTQGAATVDALAGGVTAALARTLAGADGDADPEALAAGLAAVTADTDLAASLALSEIYDASAAAAVSYYHANVTGLFAWVTDPTLMNCAICLDNEVAAPRPLDDPWPSGDVAPPIHFKCVIGSTRVVVPSAAPVVPADEPDGRARPVVAATAGQATATAGTLTRWDFGRGNIRAVTVREYVGDVVTIRTASGKELTATPNHPVATRRGWVPIAELAVGGHVLSSAGSEWEAPAIDPNVDDIPPRIEDVAQSFPVLFGAVPLAPKDFHGDGAGSKVCVVRADGLLVDDLSPGRPEHVRKHDLGGGNGAVASTIPLNPKRAGNPELLSLGPPTDGGIGRCGLAAPFPRAQFGHVDSGGGAPVAGCDAGLEETVANGPAADTEGLPESLLAFASQVTTDHGGSVNTDALGPGSLSAPTARHPGAGKAAPDSLVINAQGLGDLPATLTSAIAADDVVHIERHAFRGHVYNLDTSAGWYIGNGIVTHNCGCALIPS